MHQKSRTPRPRVCLWWRGLGVRLNGARPVRTNDARGGRFARWRLYTGRASATVKLLSAVLGPVVGLPGSGRPT